MKAGQQATGNRQQLPVARALPPAPVACCLFPAALLFALLAAVLICQGCQGSEQTDSLVVQVQKLSGENAALKDDLKKANDTLASQDAQIKALQGLGDKRLDKIFHVTKIDLGRYTGGVDLNGDGVDDGVRVYLEPKDSNGDIIKAAGTVKIQLFDLAAPPAENRVASCEFPPEEQSKHWASGFITYHFQFDCAWKTPPRHPELTLHVTFIDYLTGKTFTAQQAIKVNLKALTSAPASQPTSRR